MFGIGILNKQREIKKLEELLAKSWNPLETMRLLVELEKLKS